jgi:hypothetical protein
MPTKVVLGLLPMALGLVLGACGSASFEPTAVEDASLTTPHVELQGKKGPIGGVGGVKNGR